MSTKAYSTRARSKDYQSPYFAITITKETATTVTATIDIPNGTGAEIVFRKDRNDGELYNNSYAGYRKLVRDTAHAEQANAEWEERRKRNQDGHELARQINVRLNSWSGCDISPEMLAKLEAVAAILNK
jgi:hypothetical protein